MIFYMVNTTGLEKIKQFLLENHKRPEEATTDQALSVWAADAVTCADTNDGLAMIEIPAEDSVHGYEVAFTLDESCLDTEDFDE